MNNLIQKTWSEGHTKKFDNRKDANFLFKHNKEKIIKIGVYWDIQFSSNQVRNKKWLGVKVFFKLSFL